MPLIVLPSIELLLIDCHVPVGVRDLKFQVSLPRQLKKVKCRNNKL